MVTVQLMFMLIRVFPREQYWPHLCFFYILMISPPIFLQVLDYFLTTVYYAELSKVKRIIIAGFRWYFSMDQTMAD